MHGGVEQENLDQPNVEAMLAGAKNLQKHIETVQSFKLPFIVAINKFAKDSKEEVDALLTWCHENNYPVAEADGWAKGGDGMLDLANKVVEITDHACKYQPIYDVNDSIETKNHKDL